MKAELGKSWRSSLGELEGRALQSGSCADDSVKNQKTERGRKDESDVYRTFTGSRSWAIFFTKLSC